MFNKRPVNMKGERGQTMVAILRASVVTPYYGRY